MSKGRTKKGKAKKPDPRAGYEIHLAQWPRAGTPTALINEVRQGKAKTPITKSMHFTYAAMVPYGRENGEGTP